jgi:hypothetical protein
MREGGAGYTRADLLKAAADQGTPVSDRLVDEWVKVGLLDRPTRRGLGRGRGSVATWPEPQLKLFLTLLSLKREQQVRSKSALCNVPVFLWLYFGDAYVPLRQARRALRTWVGANRRSSLRRGRAVARLVTAEMRHPDARPVDLKRLEEEITTLAYRGRLDPDHRERVRQLLYRVHRTEERGQPGPLDPTPEGWLRLVEATLEAMGRLNELTDEDFVRARAMLQVTLREYWNTTLGRIVLPRQAFEEAARGELQERVNKACLDLLRILGLQLLSKTPAGTATGGGTATGKGGR